MEADFWQSRWRSGRIGFHQAQVTPALQQWWPRLEIPNDSRVLVPLCGKSLDMLWLAEQGHAVLGVELSELAVQQFFAENDLVAEVHESAAGQHHVSGPIEIICGDMFAVPRSVLATCTAAFDRAALIALPPEMRGDYVRHVYGGVASGARGLLITLDYPQEEMAGPPFSVPDDEVQNLFAEVAQAKLLEQRSSLSSEDKFKERGVSRFDTLVYELSKANSTPR